MDGIAELFQINLIKGGLSAQGAVTASFSWTRYSFENLFMHH